MKCSCLVAVRDEEVLLIQPKNKPCWYFPGGKNEIGESELDTLIREIDEEIDIRLNRDRLDQRLALKVPNHDSSSHFTMSVFTTTERLIEPKAKSEIRQLKWFPVRSLISQEHEIAPAVTIIMRELGYDL
ncbi:NUDIX domain-containing protein [Vibrio sp. S9_S30]|uniref:NUDIX domain-containing protein n=1 Tax=Vibrio sp. S9_S30 TaxID=2720226 RepID=UPI0016815ED1|nr:NUDIX domain-containing protein [Vibrio sp. S9_S30]MBD1559760.1 NUDIX domain-containing protein [Vibrio sp. S9_S30]